MIPSLSAAAAGVSDERSTEVIIIGHAKIRYSIRNATPRGFGPSSCIPAGRAAVSERRSWMRVSVRPLQQASHGSKCAVEDMAVPLPDGEALAIVRMEKDVEQKPRAGRNH